MLMRTTPSVTLASTGKEIAAAVLEDIKDPARWCQHTFTTLSGGACLMGSAFRVTGLDWAYRYEGANAIVANKLYAALGFGSLQSAIQFNNGSTHEAVIARLQAAL